MVGSYRILQDPVVGSCQDLIRILPGSWQGFSTRVCMSHCNYKSMPDAKFESGSLSSFGDMMSLTFALNKGMSHQIQLCTPRKWV